jgi:hypothetical protein
MRLSEIRELVRVGVPEAPYGVLPDAGATGQRRPVRAPFCGLGGFHRLPRG